MKVIYGAQVARFGRVVVFGGQHEAHFPADKPAGRHIAALGGVVTALEALGGTQEQADRDAQAATARKADVLESVWIDLVGLARVARSLDDEHPDLPVRFKTPASKSEQAITDTASAALGALTDGASGAALVELFIDGGMPDDFVADLQADLAAVEAAMAAQDDHSGGRREDTLAIEEQIAIGVKLVEKLDAYAKNRFRNDAVLLGAWIAASHLEVRRVHPKKAAAAS